MSTTSFDLKALGFQGQRDVQPPPMPTICRPRAEKRPNSHQNDVERGSTKGKRKGASRRSQPVRFSENPAPVDLFVRSTASTQGSHYGASRTASLLSSEQSAAVFPIALSFSIRAYSISTTSFILSTG